MARYHAAQSFTHAGALCDQFKQVAPCVVRSEFLICDPERAHPFTSLLDNLGRWQPSGFGVPWPWIKKEGTPAARFHEIQKPLRDDVVMQRHSSRSTVFDGASLRR